MMLFNVWILRREKHHHVLFDDFVVNFFYLTLLHPLVENMFFCKIVQNDKKCPI